MSESGSRPSGSTGLRLAAGASVVIVCVAVWFSLDSVDLSQFALVPDTLEDHLEKAGPADALSQGKIEPQTPAVENTAETGAASDAALTEDSAETAPAVEAAPMEDAAKAAPNPDPDPVLPAFDEVRRESDGMTIIAGRAAPGAILRVLQNGVEVASVTADTSGKFATFLTIQPSDEGHVLSLEQTVDGQVLASDDLIILAPSAVANAPVEEEQAGEVVVADAAPEPEPELSPQPQPKPQTPVATTEEAPQEAVAEAAVASIAETAPVAAPTLPAAEDTQIPPLGPVAESTDSPQPVITTTATAAPQAPGADALVPPAGIVVAEDAQSAVPDATAPRKPASPTASVILKSTADGVELLNTQAPEVMKRVALDTISYSDLGDVQLTGRAQAATKSVRVYLDNAPIVSLPVDAAGRWRGDLPDVDEGIYTLRVDEVAQDGSVTSRVETPLKREDPAVLVQAAADQEGPLKRITVQRGNTLWAIARERYGDGLLYVRVFQANSADIRDPDLIYPGQVFDLPD